MGAGPSEQRPLPHVEEDTAKLRRSCEKVYGNLTPLMCSPMNARVVVKGMLGVPVVCYFDDSGKTVKMKGITKTLKACFYPTYEYSGQMSAEEERTEAKKCGFTVFKHDRAKQAAARRRRIKGTELGKEVDEQLRLYANAPKKYAKLGKRIRSTTKNFVDAYSRWGLRPVKSQFPLAAPDVGIGTCVDMIALHDHGQAVLLENKTGFQGYMLKGIHWFWLGTSPPVPSLVKSMPSGNEFMKWPLSDVDNRPLHQHYLQLLVEAEIARRYWNMDFGHHCYVVQASASPCSSQSMKDPRFG